MLDDTTRYMQMALMEAQKAADAGEVPVGCVIISEDNLVLGKAHNLRETLQDPTAHAEVLAITQAAASLGSWRLENTRMYVTLEPCPMCAGAIILSRIHEVYYGAEDPKAGCAGSLMDLLTDPRFNHQPNVVPGILREECGGILSDFFRAIRAGKRSKPGIE